MGFIETPGKGYFFRGFSFLKRVRERYAFGRIGFSDGALRGGGRMETCLRERGREGTEWGSIYIRGGRARDWAFGFRCPGGST